ncbi:carboxymuconolactone decarboxylase family protein [Streptomyces atratus]|uniref:carboxymuconolactone decarboxylase family protein n=1 Tax=Streptomyces atratus TaxID=1893 RepID=UPI0016714A84|nr:carboxymuconolactone decarboxylase family protein [Streptomyces atratus]WPW29883.1 carboxymuconolactone decarboxylase family protein [Streptomyces atratus]GGT26348.1 alkyl hydroperoxide reductase AhpD [Streptomyces atratus]
MQARMQNPAEIIPEALPPLLGLVKAINKGGPAETTLELVGLRVSQINGCTFCVEGHVRNARKAGESDERLFAVSAWRDAPCFTDAERAALALAEASTRLSDRSDPVPDDIWNAAAAHFTEKELSALVLSIGLTNLFNRINVTTRQPPGKTW